MVSEAGPWCSRWLRGKLPANEKGLQPVPALLGRRAGFWRDRLDSGWAAAAKRSCPTSTCTSPLQSRVMASKMHTSFIQTSSHLYWVILIKEGKNYRLTFQEGSFPFNYITSIVESLLSSYHSGSKTFFPRQHRLHEVGKLPENLTFAFLDESLCDSLLRGTEKKV